MNQAERLDREVIREIIARYNILGDRGRVAEMVEAFAPAASLRAAGSTATGTAEIAALLSANPLLPEHKVTRHHLGTQSIEVNGADATARTYFAVLTNIGLDHHGVYVDRLAKIEGRWLITEREVRLDWQAANSVYAPLPIPASR